MRRIFILSFIFVCLLAGCSKNDQIDAKKNLQLNKYTNYEDQILEEESFNDTDSDLNELNPHRKTEEDLTKLLEPYIDKYNNSDRYTDIFHFRTELPFLDFYADKLILPHSINSTSNESIKMKTSILSGNYSIKYTYIPSMSWFDNKYIEIDSDGYFQSYDTTTYDSTIVTPEINGVLDKDKIQDALLLAVNIGFFSLPTSFDTNVVLDGATEYFSITIDNETFEIGGYERALEDDIFYKVRGTFLKIIDPKSNLRRLDPVSD